MNYPKKNRFQSVTIAALRLYNILREKKTWFIKNLSVPARKVFHNSFSCRIDVSFLIYVHRFKLKCLFLTCYFHSVNIGTNTAFYNREKTGYLG